MGVTNRTIAIIADFHLLGKGKCVQKLCMVGQNGGKRYTAVWLVNASIKR